MFNMKQRISIIIPAYNIEKELSRTLDSVLIQTYENVEIIVVNDGSKDGTGAVIEAYAAKDSRIKAIHKANGGVTSARLRGVAEATGDWIGFVDGDDWIEPDMYERLMENALEYGADISHCGYRMVFPSGRVDWYYNTGRLVEQNDDEGLRDLVCGSFVEPALWNKLYRKELFRNIAEQMDYSIKINEDVLMNYYLFKESNRAIYEDFCSYHYVLRPGSAATSRMSVNKLADPVKVSRIIWQDWPCAATLARLTRQLIGLATLADGENGQLIRPVRTQARKELRCLLQRVLRENVGMKLKIMALWASVWPASYSLVHRIHDRITGNDRKYDLN